jgi:hypothetical protein
MTSLNQHIEIGFAPAGGNGYTYAVIRGDSNVGFVVDGVAFYNLVAYTLPSPGTWVNLRYHYDAPGTSALHSIWIDGEQKVSNYARSRTYVTDMTAQVVAFSTISGHSWRFRNLRAWYVSDHHRTSTMPIYRIGQPCT